MKKYSWIVALLMALSLAFVFVGCGGDSDDDKKPGEEEGFESNLVDELGTDGKWEIVLKQTEYSDGAQYLISDAKLMQGKKITKDDEYSLELEFTVDRVPTTDIIVYFVENHPDNWEKLTNEETIDKAGLTVGTAKSVTLEFKAIKTAKAAAAAANKLVFETKEGKKPTTVADLKITFTKFVLKKEGAGEEEPPPPPKEMAVGDVLFKLTDWLEDDKAFGDPFVKAGSPTVAIAKTGITVSGRTDDWNSIDLKTGDFGFDYEKYTFDLVIKGTLATIDADTTKNILKAGQTGKPYGEVGRSSAATAVADVLTVTGKIPEKGAAYTDDDGEEHAPEPFGNIRIQTTGTQDYTITEITITVAAK